MINTPELTPDLKIEVFRLEGENEGIEQGIEEKIGDLTKAVQTLTDEHLETVTKTIEKVQQSLNNITNKVESIEVEFGIKLGGELNGIIVSASGEATFKVRLVWKGNKPN